MVTAQRSRPWILRVVLVAGVGTVVILGLLFVLGLVFGASVGPSSSGVDTFSLTLRNDTSSAVLLKQCDVKCTEFHEQDHLTPGGTVSVNTSPGNVANWWVVQGGSGQVLGCLNLQYDRPHPGLTVNISATIPCPK